MTETHTTPNQPARSEPEFGLTMTQILRNPLAALRAQMESLAGEFRADDPRQTQLRGALEHVLKLSRDVDALAQYASPRPLTPLDCTLDEILHSALRALRFEHSSRVKLANGTPGAHIVVDGPALADCLTRLLDNALSGPDEWVLLSARLESDGQVAFSIVEGVENASYHGTPRAGAPEHRAAALRLGLLLAHREIERMGGSMHVTNTLLGNTCVVVRLPAETVASN
ncbi:MAG: hypothetical protein IT454_00580 [Planctomycetes bacterium]|nr:hypothetical protein [Planctomycetota bacterium]